MFRSFLTIYRPTYKNIRYIQSVHIYVLWDTILLILKCTFSVINDQYTSVVFDGKYCICLPCKHNGMSSIKVRGTLSFRLGLLDCSK